MRPGHLRRDRVDHREASRGDRRDSSRSSSKGRDLRTEDISSRVGRRHPGRTVLMDRSRTGHRHRAITHEANHPTRPVLPVKVPVPPLPATLLKVLRLPRVKVHPRQPSRKQRVHPKPVVPTDHLVLPPEVLRDSPRDSHLAQVHHPRAEVHLRDHREATSILHTSSSSSDIRRHPMQQARTIGHRIRHHISTNQ